MESVAELPGHCEFLGKFRLNGRKTRKRISVFPWDCVDVMNSATLSFGESLQVMLPGPPSRLTPLTSKAIRSENERAGTKS